MNKILIIDDEVQIRSLLARMLELEGYEVCQAGDCKAALKQLEIQSPDVALCDVFLPDGNGVDLVLNIKKIAPNVEVILLTAHGNIPDGVQAIKNGAFDYITKGDDNNKIIPLISRAVEKAKMNVRLEKLEKKVGQMYSFDSILGESKVLKEAVSLAQKVSVTDVPVLLTGETGTGKEVFAQAIHYSSKRSKQNFVAVNCSSFSKELLESEMFGHKAGSFTGALKDKKGLFEEANNGTILTGSSGYSRSSGTTTRSSSARSTYSRGSSEAPRSYSPANNSNTRSSSYGTSRSSSRSYSPASSGGSSSRGSYSSGGSSRSSSGGGSSRSGSARR